MIDVFFCSIVNRNLDPFRWHIAQACHRRWKQEQKGHIYILEDKEGDVLGFQRRRRMIADERATTPIYVLADDDCLPGPGKFIEKAVEIMEPRPLAVLSMLPTNATINRWTPEGYSPYEDDEVMEHVSVGGIRFCRKLHVVDERWPQMKSGERGYDGIHSEMIRELGSGVGYFKNLTMAHIGEGYSSIWIKK